MRICLQFVNICLTRFRRFAQTDRQNIDFEFSGQKNLISHYISGILHLSNDSRGDERIEAIGR